MKSYQGHKTESMDDYYTFFQQEDLEAAVRGILTKENRSVTKIKKAVILIISFLLMITGEKPNDK